MSSYPRWMHGRPLSQSQFKVWRLQVDGRRSASLDSRMISFNVFCLSGQNCCPASAPHGNPDPTFLKSFDSLRCIPLKVFISERDVETVCRPFLSRSPICGVPGHGLQSTVCDIESGRVDWVCLAERPLDLAPFLGRFLESF